MSGIEEQLFPTGGPIDEEQLIGREAVLEGLTARFVAGADALIVEPRQVGKSSLLRAAIQRSQREADAVVASSDLKVDGVGNSTQLGARLLERARETGAGGFAARGAQIKVAVGKAGKVLIAPMEAVAAAAELLGVPAEATQVVTALGEMAARAGDVPFDRVLTILEADATLRSRPTTIVLDEVQEIGLWGADGTAVENVLAAAARRPNRKLGFVSSGSERHALESLFAEDRPLRVISDRFPLPEIAPDDWAAGLRARLVRGGLDIDDRAIAALLDASGGHPLVTMHVAKATFRAAVAEGATRIEVVHVGAGVAWSERQLWWKEFTA